MRFRTLFLCVSLNFFSVTFVNDALRFCNTASVTTRTHARSQLSPMKQYDYSSIVVTFLLTKNFN